MPYIDKRKRQEFEQRGRSGKHPVATTAGELNYELTLKCVKYLEDNGVNYQHFNDCIGALEGAKLELYRRLAAPYEDTKIAANGDVYPPSIGGYNQ